MEPDPSESCGPYTPIDEDGKQEKSRSKRSFINPKHDTHEPDHDTICQIAMSGGDEPRVVIGTTTNGLDHKIPGYFFLLYHQ